MKPYIYKAKCIGVIDGDTAVVDIDVGFHLWVKGVTIRFARINAWELRKDERKRGLEARKWLKVMIENSEIVIEVIKPKGKKLTDSFGRYIAEVFVEETTSHRLININDLLVEKGHARLYEYK